jgi:hypothetical protein
MADLGRMKFLRRFPESKHEQIRQVMSYLQMCGLSGRDIVSIGGWIDRHAARERLAAAKERVQGYIDQGTIRAIGRDDPGLIMDRFKYRGITGDYNFYMNDWGRAYRIVSMKTKQSIVHHVTDREWPGNLHWNTRDFYNMIMDIGDGRVQLNF